MDRNCLDCGNAIIGRADKKFCDDACRSNYNNRKNGENDFALREINRILKKNRNILARLNPNGTQKVGRQKLRDAGFNFKYHTHAYRNGSGKQYTYCYEYGYLELDKENLLVVRWDFQ